MGALLKELTLSLGCFSRIHMCFERFMLHFSLKINTPALQPAPVAFLGLKNGAHSMGPGNCTIAEIAFNTFKKCCRTIYCVCGHSKLVEM